MDIDVSTTIAVISGLLIAVGILGVVIPVLPGLILCWAGVALWALFGGAGWGRWLVLGVATLVALCGVAAKYAWPGRRLKQLGIPNQTLLIGGVLGIAGFFVIPVVGLVAGFVVGIWLAEQLRLRDREESWRSTKHALKAAGLSMLIELGSALGIAVVWVAGLIMA